MIIHTFLGMPDIQTSNIKELLASEEIVKTEYRKRLKLAENATEQEVNDEHAKRYAVLTSELLTRKFKTNFERQCFVQLMRKFSSIHTEYGHFLAMVRAYQFQGTQVPKTSHASFLNNNNAVPSQKASSRIHAQFKYAIEQNRTQEVQQFLSEYTLIESLYAQQNEIEKRRIFPAIYRCNDEIFQMVCDSIPNLEKVSGLETHRNARKNRFLADALEYFLMLDEYEQENYKGKLLDIINKLNLTEITSVLSTTESAMAKFAAKYQEFFTNNIQSKFNQKQSAKVREKLFNENTNQSQSAEPKRPAETQEPQASVKTAKRQKPTPQSDVLNQFSNIKLQF